MKHGRQIALTLALTGTFAFAGGESDVSYGHQGRAIVDEHFPTYVTAAEEGHGVQIGSTVCNNTDPHCSVHLYRLNESGILVKDFGVNGHAVIPLDGKQWPKAVGPRADVFKIVPEAGGMRLLLADRDTYYAFAVEVGYWGHAVPGAVNIGGNVSDTLFREDGTFFTAYAQNAGTYILAKQKNGDTLDLFGSGGTALIPASDIAARSANLSKGKDGKIRVSAWGQQKNGSAALKLSQLDRYGNLDLAFGSFGSVEYSFDPLERDLSAVADSQGRTYVYTGNFPCRSEQDFRIWRLDARGDIDTTFGDRGFVWLANVIGKKEYVALPLTVDTQGRLLVRTILENETTNTILRFSEKGELDSTFAKQGRLTVSGSIQKVLIENSGKYLVVGQTETTLWTDRFLP